MEKLKLITVLMILIFGTSLVNATLYYNIDAHYNQGKIEIKNINVIFSQEDLILNEGEYTLEIKDGQTILETSNFFVPNSIAYDNTDESGKLISGGIIELNETSFNIIIPYYEDAKEIIIYNTDKQELTKNSLTHFTKNPETIDYPKDSQETDEETDEQTQDSQEQQPESDTGWKILLWALIILTILFVVLILRVRKKK